MQIDPGRRLPIGEQRRVGLVETSARERDGGAPLRRPQRPTGAVDNRERHQAGDRLPAAPAMEAGEAIRAHDPHEPHARTARDEVAEGIDRKRRADLLLEPCHVDARAPRHDPRRCQTRRDWWKTALLFKRIAGRYHPPDAVEPQPFQRKQADMLVPRMRRIERAAVEADPQAGRMGRQGDHFAAPYQDRTCPAPRTRYLKDVSCSKPTGPRACMRPVAMPISAPKPNSPPSANWVEALWRTIAESTSARKRSAAAASAVTIASVWCEP